MAFCCCCCCCCCCISLVFPTMLCLSIMCTSHLFETGDHVRPTLSTASGHRGGFSEGPTRASCCFGTFIFSSLLLFVGPRLTRTPVAVVAGSPGANSKTPADGRATKLDLTACHECHNDTNKGPHVIRTPCARFALGSSARRATLLRRGRKYGRCSASRLRKKVTNEA